MGGMPGIDAVRRKLFATAPQRRGASPPRLSGLIDRPDYWRLWLVGLVVFGVRWLEMLAVAVFAYERTGSAFIVALLTMLRMLPMALVGALVGAVAERIERHTALVCVVVSLLATDLTLAVLAWTGRLAVWHLALASLLNGVAWTSDNPVRRTMIGEVVGAERIGAAMSIDVGANNASQIVGPALGGALLAHFGIAGAFTVSVACYFVALAAALRVRHRNRVAAAAATGVIGRMTAGLRLVRRDRRLAATLVITVIYNVFGWPFTSMVPVIGQGSLHLGPTGIGVLASMGGVGSFLGAVAIGFLVRPALYARLYLGAVIVYLLLVPLFALAPLPSLAGAVLLSTGLANAGFSIMQATLVFLAAPADMRSSVFGVLSVCIGTGMIGFLLIGLFASAMGAPMATAATGIEGLVALWLTRRWWRPLASS
jgi:predicted MFS family arabinose efflux permease